MKRKLSDACRRTRYALQELHDSGEEPRGALAAHLADCRNCSRFRNALRDLSEHVKKQYSSSSKTLSAPDFTAVFSRADRGGRRRRRILDGLFPLRHSRLLLGSAAAVPVLCIALGAGLMLNRGAATRAGVETFVDDLYGAAFLEGVEYDRTVSPEDEGAGLESWLSEIAGAEAGAGSGFFDP
jgi:hypothetical protein